MFDVLIRACIHDHASISDLGHKTGIVACLDYILLLLFKAHDIFLNREEIMYIPIQKKEGGGFLHPNIAVFHRPIFQNTIFKDR